MKFQVFSLCFLKTLLQYFFHTIIELLQKAETNVLIVAFNEIYPSFYEFSAHVVKHKQREPVLHGVAVYAQVTSLWSQVYLIQSLMQSSVSKRKFLVSPMPFLHQGQRPYVQWSPFPLFTRPMSSSRSGRRKERHSYFSYISSSA